jgi:hypothetical protein
MEPIELAKNRGARLLERLEAALAAGEIDEAGWYREVAAAITPAYLAADTPWAQSGRSGDEATWTYARSLIADAINRPGTFLDIGCANGYLMECMAKWAPVEPYGLDISPELAELARRRLPAWADRIFVGNAIDWAPPMRFDYVRTGLEYVPRRRQRDLVARLLDEVVARRLIIGTYSEEAEPVCERELASWGFAIAGRSERPHRDPRLGYRVVWVDRLS